MDLHHALKIEKLKEFQCEGVEFRLVRLQVGKDQFRLGLHGAPHSWSPAGPQTTDHLANIGFKRGPCALLPGTECFSRAVTHGFDVDSFMDGFSKSFRQFKSAERYLSACGIYLPLPEGQGYFFGKSSSRSSSRSESVLGDGHLSAGTETLKAQSDDWFEFKMTWLAEPSRGWVTHYAPKHPPLSQEMEAAFRSLGLKSFGNCPEFDFEPCSWRFTQFQSDGVSRFGLNNQIAHSQFDAHSQNFGRGIQALMAAQLSLRPVDLAIYPEGPSVSTERNRQPEAAMSSKAIPLSPVALSDHIYDVAISFAGVHRAYAEELTVRLQDAGVRVFYDDLYPEQLWGKDLPVHFAKVYGTESRYCVIFVSKEYSERMWTQHERTHAVARALQDHGNEYILQIRMDDAELAGIPPTQGYLSIDTYSIGEISEILLKKLGSAT